MRKQDKIIVWPVYFDLGKTRVEGRRVSKTLALQAPKISEIEAAMEKMGLEFECVPNKGYPKTSWNKSGLLLVEKKGSKEQVITGIAKQMQKIRAEMPK
jgi:signal recognition particle subunit SRP19